MELQDIREVMHLDDPNEVTKYLKNGWYLLHKYTVALDPDYPENLKLIYALGAVQEATNQQSEIEFASIDLNALGDL